MSVSTLIDIESAPAESSDLWMLAYLFTANWNQEVNVNSAFETAIKFGLTASEQRYGLLGKPVRSITISLTAKSKKQSHALRMLAQRASICRSLFPLYSDATELEIDTMASSTVLSADTTFRRIKAGSRIVIFDDTSETQVPTFDVVTVTATTDTTITILEGLDNDYSAGAYIIPLIEARIIVETSGTVLTDTTGTLTLTAMEEVGDTQLTLAQALDSVPSGFSTHDSLPVLHLLPNFNGIQFSNMRRGEAIDSGITSIQTMYGVRGASGFSLPMLCKTREEAWDVLKFFESRGGQLYAFWAISPFTEYVATAVGGGGLTLTVEANGPLYDWNLKPHMAVVKTDGSIAVREIVSVIRNSDLDTVTFGNAIAGLTINDIDRVTVAHRSRLNSDELVERWRSNQVMETVLTTRELLEEKEIEIADLTKLTSSDLLTEFEPGNCGGVVPGSCPYTLGTTPVLRLVGEAFRIGAQTSAACTPLYINGVNEAVQWDGKLMATSAACLWTKQNSGADPSQGFENYDMFLAECKLNLALGLWELYIQAEGVLGIWYGQKTVGDSPYGVYTSTCPDHDPQSYQVIPYE